MIIMKYRKLKGTPYDPYSGGPYSNAYGDVQEHRDSMKDVVLWYERPSYVLSFLILFFPVGLFLMWRNLKWNPVVKTILSVVGVIISCLFYYYWFSN